MKALIVFYSRTGTTKKVAIAVSKSLKCDLEEILDTKSRRGIFGYLKSGKEALLKKIPNIQDTKKNPSNYNLIIIGTPVWAHSISSPIRAYLIQNKGKFRKVAFFCTMGGSGSKSAFNQLKGLCEKTPFALLELKTNEVTNNQHLPKVKKFADELKSKP